MKDITCIPDGPYCYDEKGTCPYWSLKSDLPPMENGYCAYLDRVDEDLGLLWDQCKELDCPKDWE